MRRFSERNQLTTLSELNVTPLLDLAFVLLIIFMITTPLMESSSDLVLPTGNAGNELTAPVSLLAIYKDGTVRINGDEVADLAAQLAVISRSGPEAMVAVRADRELPVQRLVEVMDLIRESGINKVRLLSTEAAP